ncbi:patatin-like phospholipase family protein [Shewanella psychrotolerans]|uniref:patatin-like phospholipase family protein n=1 Tax=Shewanella psychrotolerans TaxID=2864206 RepID=UPI0021AC4A1C|nr:patatin-like phospholipase family protein [Shewanella psychrotolerans]
MSKLKPRVRFLAGPTAFEQIREQGLHPALFSQLLAASGGPKWIGIAALDRMLFGEFFKDRDQPLHTLGASSGAWRLACLAQDDPQAAYDRLERAYIQQRYDVKPTPSQVSQQVSGIIDEILGDQVGQDIVDNPIINSHFIACRARHLSRMSNRVALGAGLATTAMSNLLSRKTLGLHFQRYVFGRDLSHSPFSNLNDLPSHYVGLSKHNIQQVLLATGSIPWVLAPVTEIDGAPIGHYYDGGITDYHFDLAVDRGHGLTLYPHFNSNVLPGWFDKSLPWRRAKQNYHDALILVPSDDYLASLPFGKLPDRGDFTLLTSDERIRYWQKAAAMSQVLADDFEMIWRSGDVAQYLEPF